MSEHERQRLARLERQMRDNLLKRKALAKAKARREVDDAARALDAFEASSTPHPDTDDPAEPSGS